MSTFTIKQNDLRKDLEKTLVEDGSVVDLSDAMSVNFHLNTKPEKGDEYNRQRSCYQGCHQWSCRVSMGRRRH